ncbi:MAG TPA: hypothetical protein VF037_09795, partial [Gemmatimonadales bacterium]
EIVSYGEHLAQAADRIVSAGQGTARDLRLYTLAGTFRSVAVPGTDPVTPALARLGRAARAAIGGGAAAEDPAGFAAALRDAGAQLRRVAEGTEHADVARELDTIARRLGLPDDVPPVAAPARQAAPEPPPPPRAAPPAAAVAESEAVPIEALAYDGESVFAAAEKAPAAPVTHPDVLPIESLAPAGRLGLERAYDRYRELVHAPAGAVAAPPLDEDVVDISSLCYSGRRALERAAEVQAEIARRAGSAGPLGDVEPLVRELLDLVPLALAG